MFRRDFDNLHSSSDHPVLFRFPVENVDSIVGPRSLASGETTSLTFASRNIGRYALGSYSPSTFKRELGVQFFVDHTRSDFDVSSVTFVSVDGKRATVGMDAHLLSGGGTFHRGHYVEIQSLPSGSTVDLSQSLTLSPDVLPYSRLTLQAEVVLQDVPRLLEAEGRTEVGRRGRRVVQRRKIEIVSEPAFGGTTAAAGGDADVIIVSTLSTAREQYIAWMDLVQNTMGLRVESYSASRYGHIGPYRTLPDGRTLREAFAGKLVIVLNNKYSPIRKDDLKLRPSALLPRGCGQGSGYDPSTRWLIAGSGREAERQLLDGLIVPTPGDVDTTEDEFPSISKFKNHILGIVMKEPSAGRVQEDDAINHHAVAATAQLLNKPTASKRIVKLAESLRRWLSEADPLRQYWIEHRASNVATVVKGGSNGPLKT